VGADKDIVERLQSAGHFYATPHDAILYEAAAEIGRLRGEVAMTEQQKADRDLLLTGTSFMRDGKRIDPATVYIDRAEAGELPELPEPDAYCAPFIANNSEAFAWPGNDRKPEHLAPLYTQQKVTASGQQCARAASCGGGACHTCETDGVFADDGAGPFDCYSCGKRATGAIIYSADVTDEHIERLAKWMCRNEMPDRYIGDLNAVMEWRDKWARFIPEARAALAATLATPPTPSAGVEVPAWVTELVEADKEFDEAERAVRDAKYHTGKHHWQPLPKNSPLLLRFREAKSRRAAAITAALEGGK
jgi:hypothetical protein